MIWHGSLWRSRLVLFWCWLGGHRPRLVKFTTHRRIRDEDWKCRCGEHTWVARYRDGRRVEWTEVPF